MADLSGALPKVDTPFVQEDDGDNPSRQPVAKDDGLECPWCKGCFAKSEFKVWPPKPEHKGRKVGVGSAPAPNSDELERGRFADDVASIAMKILYAAREARFDLLRAIGFLACQITKWDVCCDKRLHRLMCYIEATIKHR